jgi:CubicO group peptidase (beta-lactamase class C family)
MRRVAAAVLAVCAAGSTLTGGTQPAAWSETDSIWLRDRMAESRAALKAPGLAVGVAAGGSIVFAGGVGSIDLEGRSPVTATTRFRVASVTKPVTATAVLQLVEAGRLVLDAPARTYCAEYPAKQPADPTVRQLLAHQSGIPHTTDADDTTIAGDFPRLGASVRYYGARPLAFAPGRETLYTSWGYALLGCVIEGAAGQPYWDVADGVLRRAGVTTAARDTPGFAAPDFSPGYRPGRSGVRPSVVVDTRFKTPASGLIISTSDLLRFGLALTGETLLGPSSRAEMFRPHPPATGPARYALGWQVTTPSGEAPAFVHSGSMEGVTALLYLVPADGDAIVILSNLERSVPAIVPLLRAIRARIPPRTR